MDELPVTNMVPAPKKTLNKMWIAIIAAIALTAVVVTVAFMPKGDDFRITIGVGQNNKNAGMEADSMLSMGLWNNYIASDKLAKESSEAPVYSAKLMPYENMLGKIITAFNIDGKTVEDQGETFFNTTVGTLKKGSDWEYEGFYASLYGTSKKGLINWNVNDGSLSELVYMESYGDAEASKVTTEDMVVINESKRLLTALGYSESDYKLEAHPDSAIAVFQLDGEPTSAAVQFSFYNGKLSSASGTNITGFTQEAPSVKVVSAYDGVERLNDLRYYAAAPFNYNQPAVAYDTAGVSADSLFEDPETVTVSNDGETTYGEVTVDPTATLDPVAGEDVDPTTGSGSSEGTEGTVTVDPVPSSDGSTVTEEGNVIPAKTDVIISKAKLVWVMVESADGRVYFVRGWEYYTTPEAGDEYSVGAVIALPEGTIQFKEVKMIPMGRD